MAAGQPSAAPAGRRRGDVPCRLPDRAGKIALTDAGGTDEDKNQRLQPPLFLVKMNAFGHPLPHLGYDRFGVGQRRDPVLPQAPNNACHRHLSATFIHSPYAKLGEMVYS